MTRGLLRSRSKSRSVAPPTNPVFTSALTASMSPERYTCSSGDSSDNSSARSSAASSLPRNRSESPTVPLYASPRASRRRPRLAARARSRRSVRDVPHRARYACLDRMRETRERAADAELDNEIAALALEAWAVRRPADVPGRRARALLRPPRPGGSGVRRTSGGAGCTTTTGAAVAGAGARRFYTATPGKPLRVTLRRRFRRTRLLDLQRRDA